MKSLDFMIIGAQKAGTTALSSFLAQHPNICMAKGKEVHLFDAPNYRSGTAIEEINRIYAPHFDATPTNLWGEATPLYLYWTEIIPELYRYNPKLKLIILLRDPVERAISHFEMERARGNEHSPLWQALLLEQRRLRRSSGREEWSSRRLHSYLDRGKYVRQIEAVRHYFPDDQLLVIENSELSDHHSTVLRSVFEFLGVAAEYDIQPRRVFKGNYFPKKSWLSRFLGLYFYRYNLQLKSILEEMGIKRGWPWLSS